MASNPCRYQNQHSLLVLRLHWWSGFNTNLLSLWSAVARDLSIRNPCRVNDCAFTVIFCTQPSEKNSSCNGPSTNCTDYPFSLSMPSPLYKVNGQCPLHPASSYAHLSTSIAVTVAAYHECPHFRRFLILPLAARRPTAGVVDGHLLHHRRPVHIHTS